MDIEIRGILWPSNKKKSANCPDYDGKATIGTVPGGEQCKAVAWLKTGKTGGKYLQFVIESYECLDRKKKAFFEAKKKGQDSTPAPTESQEDSFQ